MISAINSLPEAELCGREDAGDALRARAAAASRWSRIRVSSIASIAIAALLVAGCDPNSGEWRKDRHTFRVVDNSEASRNDQLSVRHAALSDGPQADAARVALADGRLTQSEADQIFAEIMSGIDRELAK